MKFRWKLLLCGIGILIAPLLLIAIIHLKLKYNVESYKNQLLAKGEKLTIAEWIPRSSTNGNAAQIFQDSVRPFSSIKLDHHPSVMRMIAFGKAQALWKYDEIYDSDSKKRTNIWLLIENDFKSNREAIEKLRDATSNEKLFFPLAYEQGFRLLLPHLVKVKQGATWLSAATEYELHRGNKTEAAEDLKALLRLVKNYRDEPLLISQLVRIACLQIAFSTTWDALQYSEWDDKQLQEFQENWAAIDLGGMEETFQMERAMGIQMIEEARKSAQYPLLLVSGGTSTFKDDWDEFSTKVFTEPAEAFKVLFNQPNQKIWSYLLSYRDELELLKMWQAGLEANRAMEKEKQIVAPLEKLNADFEAQGPSEIFFGGDERSIVTKQMTKLASAKIAQKLAETACALHRFKLESGKFPTELKQLAPKYLSKMPVDPMDGQPLRYRLNPEGTFLFYSIGENGVDDGGDPKPENISTNQNWIRARHPLYGRDWVWPLPATEEQIIEWERHESGGK